MKSQQDKEEWIDRVLQSIEGITPVASNPYLHHKVLIKLKNEKYESISVRTIWWSTAAGIVLVILNLAALKTEIGKSVHKSDVSIVVSEYQLNEDPSALFEN
jgi:hypothetical protein